MLCGKKLIIWWLHPKYRYAVWLTVWGKRQKGLVSRTFAILTAILRLRDSAVLCNSVFVLCNLWHCSISIPCSIFCSEIIGFVLQPLVSVTGFQTTIKWMLVCVLDSHIQNIALQTCTESGYLLPSQCFWYDSKMASIPGHLHDVCDTACVCECESSCAVDILLECITLLLLCVVLVLTGWPRYMLGSSDSMLYLSSLCEPVLLPPAKIKRY